MSQKTEKWYAGWWLIPLLIILGYAAWHAYPILLSRDVMKKMVKK